MPKCAEIIAIGSELLTPQRQDTNSLFITEQLNLLGVEVIAKQIVGDHRERLTETIRVAVRRSHVVILSGGLGPTEDDLTREATAAALGRKLQLDLAQEAVLISRFRQINRPMAPNNIRQAYLIDGAEALQNPFGTAPGQFLHTDRGALALLPGPPRELKPMFVNELIPRLRPVLPRQVIKVRSFRITGMGESDLDALISPVYSKYTNPATTVLSTPGDLFVSLRAQGETETEADCLLREVGNSICRLVGDRIYSENPDEPLEAVVGKLLRRERATVSTAESCTGGLIAYRLTEQGGSSDYFVAGYVTYSEAQKQRILGVPKETIQKHTAVSEAVAAAMAEGARAQSGSTYAISTTGYAGPAGGTEYDPVGTVYIGLSMPSGTKVCRMRHGGDRFRIRTLTAQTSLDLLRRALLKPK
jgi:nicotinamide-nucleotide amidase